MSANRSAMHKPNVRRISLDGPTSPRKPSNRGQFIDFKPRPAQQSARKAPKRPVRVAISSPTVKVKSTKTTTTVSSRRSQPRRVVATPPRPAKPTYEEDILDFYDEEVNSNDNLEDMLDDFIEEDIEDATVIQETSLESAADFIADDESSTAAYASALAGAPDAAAKSADKPAKSPFIPSVNVDKRPLSARRIVYEEDYDSSSAPSSIKEEDFHGNLHNTYSRRKEAKKTPTPTVVAQSPKESRSSAGMIIAIILTIVLGAGVGACIYLLFFQ